MAEQTTVGAFLTEVSEILTKAHISTPRLDTLILLEDSLGKDRALILAEPNLVIPKAKLEQLLAQVKERTVHTPLAYIRGKVEFYRRNFHVNSSVLVPRPETESIIELLKELPITDGTTILDLGTGSGCIGITAALEFPQASVMLSDISDKAIQVATVNAKELGAHVSIVKSDLLKEITKSYDILLANLPYVPQSYPINIAAKFEPEIALFSGPDGLDDYREMWRQVGSLHRKPAHIIIESLLSQHHPLALMARNENYTLHKTDGFVQLFSL